MTLTFRENFSKIIVKNIDYFKQIKILSLGKY